ncbi:hypothetical protein [Victivallis vadensis]|jgi:hypothetical protein|uniref:hypothetical protein n=1 Tax=Victivallis vadensis TaxID=172901 RepID=UPI00266D1F98|nr:hypothetical protein [Victivallis vadensis]
MNPVRFRKLRLPLLAGLTLLAILGAVALLVRREPLTADQILAKRQWTAEELSDSLGRAFAPQTNRDKRREVLRHLREQLQKYPAQEQARIRAEAMRRAMNEYIRQLRTLPPEERRKMIDGINRGARKSFEAVSHLSDEQKKRIKSQMDSPEGEAVREEANRIMSSVLTADERRDLAPAMRYWINTVREL